MGGRRRRELWKVDGKIVDVHRVGVLEADAAAARKTGSDPRTAGMEERGQPGLGDDLVERIERLVVREERLDVRMELEAPDSVIADQALR